MMPILTIGGLGSTRMTSAGAGYSAQATQFFDRLSVVPSGARKTLYATMIDALVTAQAYQTTTLRS